MADEIVTLTRTQMEALVSETAEKYYKEGLAKGVDLGMQAVATSVRSKLPTFTNSTVKFTLEMLIESIEETLSNSQT